MRKKISTKHRARRSPPPRRKFARLSARWRGNTILTSIPVTNPRKKNSRLSPKQTIFSAIPKSAKFTTSLVFIPTTLILRRRKPTRKLEPAAEGAIPGDFQEDSQAPGRACPSTSVDSISPIWEGDRAAEAEEVAVSATFFLECSEVAAAGLVQKKALSREAIWNIRSTFLSGRRSEAA